MSDSPNAKPPARPAQSSQREVEGFIKRMAQIAPRGAGVRGRLIFALDATASREATWDRAQHLQAEMFEVTRNLGGLDVQLVYYRGFRECKASPWVADAEGLRDRMLAVRCLGGNTQIGRVLVHVLSQTRKQQVNAVVFIGDCFEEDIDSVCATAGELGLQGVRVFMFREGSDPAAARAFPQIARLTGGACCAFDSASASQLRDLLAAVASYAAGGIAALEDLGRRRGGEVLRLTHQIGGASSGTGAGRP